MNCQEILQLTDSETYHQELQKIDLYYQHRIEMLEIAQKIFQSKRHLSDLTLEERSIILGQNSPKHSQYNFDPNLFGAPGGNGEVKGILASKYNFLDQFYDAIPRTESIDYQQYQHLVTLFKAGIKDAGCSKVPFVLFTRILTVTRPDTFVSAAANALDPVCDSLNLKKVSGDFDKYWHELLATLHQLPLFKNSVGKQDNHLLALIDGLTWIDPAAGTIGITGSNVRSNVQQNGEMKNMSLNQILYGPPGTGKTYKTIEAAVNATEPTFTWSNSDELKARYDELVNEKRIRFVTFHQSFGYEEFVEGIKPDVSDTDSICYSVESGIFKQICEDASLSTLPDNTLINKDGRVWKISIQSTSMNPLKAFCFENNVAAVGWDDTADMHSTKDGEGEQSGYYKSLGKNDQNSLIYFSKQMTKGDLVLCIDSNTSVEAVGIVEGDYYFNPQGAMNDGVYRHLIPVKWLAKGFSVDFKQLNGNKRFNLPTCYPLWRISVPDAVNHLENNKIHIGGNKDHNANNYVLIIDEINRGNISKIFGELITLIEPSKREGNDESLKLSLPYSGKPFSVPNNLYIIGTMNTADRSLTMIDTALRRRFDFVEMMPEPLVLECPLIHGINLVELLTTLNQRIEVLYDREHTLGHAFFIPVKDALVDENEDVAFQKLKSVFQNKIIPLLQEYFFEDWQKIRLVLGDNQKPADLQFVTEEKLSSKKLDDLFGNGHGLNQYGDEQRRYALQLFSEPVWQEPQAYLGIYSKVVSQKAETEMTQVSDGANLA